MSSLLFWFIVCLSNVYAIDLKDLNFLALINSPDVLKESFKNDLDKAEMTLCQKHSQLYFNEIQNKESGIPNYYLSFTMILGACVAGKI